MGIFNKAKLFGKAKEKAEQALAEHPDKVGRGIDKLADTVDRRTGGKYADQIDRGADSAKDRAADYGRREGRADGGRQDPPAQH